MESRDHELVVVGGGRAIQSNVGLEKFLRSAETCVVAHLNEEAMREPVFVASGMLRMWVVLSWF